MSLNVSRRLFDGEYMQYIITGAKKNLLHFWYNLRDNSIFLQNEMKLISGGVQLTIKTVLYTYENWFSTPKLRFSLVFRNILLV